MENAYDEKRFDPAAPIMKTEIAHPTDDSKIIKIDMQLDSGADMTCFPRSIINKIPNLHSGSVKAIDYSGHITEKITKFILIGVGEEKILLEAIPINNSIGLLGRDYLNKYCTVLDGPNFVFKICEVS